MNRPAIPERHAVDPAPTQRVGAYAVVVRDDALLLTRISPRGYPPGWWGLPGGGIDQGEPPASALVRELYEETGLAPVTVRLVDVHDVHTQAPGRNDQYEDYHGIHLLYAVSVEPDAVAQVTESDGTTDEVRWVPLADLAGTHGFTLLPVVEHVLERLGQFTAAAGAADVPASDAAAGSQNSTA